MSFPTAVTRDQIALAMELRTMGLSWRKIGDKLKMSHGKIYTQVMAATKVEE